MSSSVATPMLRAAMARSSLRASVSAAVMQSVPEVAVTPPFRRAFAQWAREHPLTHVDPRAEGHGFFRSLPRSDPTVAAGVAVVSASLRRRRPLAVEVHRTCKGVVVGARIGPWQVVGAIGR